MSELRLECGNCGVSFELSDRQAKRQRSKHPSPNVACSPACASALGRRKRKVWPTYGPCPTCGEHFTSRYKKRFCSLACYVRSPAHVSAQRKASAAALAKRPPATAKEPRKKKERTEYTCRNCGKKWTGRRKLYCGRECYRKYMAARFDRWIASPQDIALPQAYDEFMMMENLPCLVEGCDWEGHGLAQHVNLAHGIPVAEFKRAVGFNLGTGLVSPSARENLRNRSHIHNPTFGGVGPSSKRGPSSGYKSREGAEHRAKSAAVTSEEPGPMRLCKQCNTTFQQKHAAGRTLYCSTACRSKWYVESSRRPASCVVCGATFQAAGHQQKRGKPCCSIECRQRLNGRQPKRAPCA